MIMAILLVVFFVVISISGMYLYLKEKTLNEIRADVYQLFLEAERNPKFAESGLQKMKWVLSKARGLLPDWAGAFITDELLAKVVQAWFDAIKDLLDDGKLNGTDK